MDRLFYTLEEAAGIRGVGDDVIRKGLHDGTIAAVFESGKWKISRRLFDAAFDAECIAQAQGRRPAEDE